MSIFDIFSKRQRRLRGDVPDVVTYDQLPQPLMVQIVQIMFDTLGDVQEYLHYKQVADAYQEIVEILRKEYGVFRLVAMENYKTPVEELIGFFLQETNVERCIDVIELSFTAIDTHVRKYDYIFRPNPSGQAQIAIAELNARFKEHGVGYQFVEGEIIRVDSELLHVEAVKPALRLLNVKEYKGAQEEFFAAYDHYRHGRHKEALNDCLKSFESAMKAICDKRKWAYGNKPTATSLIKTCFDNGLVPPFWQQHLNSLRSTLESGIPTARNNLSAHGQGATPVDVPDYLVAYVLHMTASALVFLTTAEKHLK